MNEYLIVLMLAMLPALGNLVGGLLSEVVDISSSVLSLSLHAATGIVLAVVAIELMPEILAADPPWVIVAAFIAGGVAFVIIDQALNHINARFGDGQSDNSSWMILFGVTIDLFTDGILVGVGTIVSLSLAILLALGQVPGNLPEGFATIASFKRGGMSRPRRLLISALFVLPVLIGASIGYLAVRGQPEIVQLALLSFAAGILTTVVVEEIIPAAHKDEKDARTAAFIFVVGFGLFTLISVYFS